jgi:hypothetical protein
VAAGVRGLSDRVVVHRNQISVELRGRATRQKRVPSWV